MSDTLKATATFTASATSDSVNLSGYAGFSIYIPATASTAALTYKQKVADGTYKDIYDQGAIVTDVVAAGAVNIINHNLFSALTDVKIVSDTSETMVCEIVGLVS